ncbi:SERPINB10 isoform 4, partial [Pan troglodytes]
SVNKLFGEKSASFREEYIRLCQKYYSSEPQAVDFLECAEEARKKINSWVKTQTKGKISNLLPEGSVDGDTRMVLVNAVYFKGKWKTPFEKKLNGLYPFRVNSAQRTPVQMMYLREKLNIGYIEDLKAQILELPYAGNVSMFLLLPDEIADVSTGLELLESEITYDKLNKWTSKDKMAEDDVELKVSQLFSHNLLLQEQIASFAPVEENKVSSMDALATSINQFALELRKKLAESAQGKNIFFSSWSISTSLTMVYLGAKGTTAAQMAQVLQFNRDQGVKS